MDNKGVSNTSEMKVSSGSQKVQQPDTACSPPSEVKFSLFTSVILLQFYHYFINYHKLF